MWIFINFKNNSQIPVAFTTFVLGSTIALFIAFFLNIFSKISAHAVGMGGLIGMVTILMLLYDYHSFAFEIPFVGSMEMSLNTLLMLIILLAGIVGSSRLLLKAHEPVQIYSGYIVGFSAQFFALFALF
jgi:membrane-associated phospholipid phosphatase